MKNNIISKFLSFSYGSWIGLIIGVLTTAISTRILMPDDFGKASMFILTINVLMIVGFLGMDQSFVRFFYEEEVEQRGKLLYKCIIPSLISSLLISLIIFLFYKEVSFFLYGKVEISLIMLTIAGFMTSIIFKFSVLVIRMQQKGHLFSIVEILNKSFNLIFLLLFYLLMGSNYKILINSTVLTYFGLSIYNIYKEKDIWRPKHITITNNKTKTFDLIQYGFPLIFTLIITYLFQSFDKIALRNWSTYEELGLYASAFKIVALVSVVQTNFTSFWVPLSFENYKNSSNDISFFTKSFQLVAFVMFLIGILSIAFRNIIVFLLGSNYRLAANIMPFLIFMPVMYTISETTVIGINFKNKPKYHVLIAGLSCVTNIVGNFLLVPQYGAIGAAISTAGSYILFFYLRTYFSMKLMKIDYALIKISTMIICTVIYAFLAILFDSVLTQFISFVGIVIILLLVHKEELKYITKYIKDILN